MEGIFLSKSLFLIIGIEIESLGVALTFHILLNVVFKKIILVKDKHFKLKAFNYVEIEVKKKVFVLLGNVRKKVH